MSGSTARITASAEETEGLGERLAPALAVGDVVTLTGPLGSGKTRLVAGLARGLAAGARVRSPSFVVIHEYHGRLLLAHVDFYRLETAEADALGLEEYAERGALAVEWGEKLPPSWRAEALALRFEILSGNERRISAAAAAGRGLELLRAWDAPLPPGIRP